jgi:hypothetical protein
LLSIRETDRRQFMKSQAGRSAWIPTELLREFVRHPVDRLLDRGDILSRPAIFPGLDQANVPRCLSGAGIMGLCDHLS